MGEMEREPWARCCELAGRLAEAGARSVTLIVGEKTSVMKVRETDLPQVLYAAPLGAMLTWAGGRAVRSAEGWRGAQPDEPGTE